jgi:hypothetical protein
MFKPICNGVPLSTCAGTVTRAAAMAVAQSVSILRVAKGAAAGSGGVCLHRSVRER